MSQLIPDPQYVLLNGSYVCTGCFPGTPRTHDNICDNAAILVNAANGIQDDIAKVRRSNYLSRIASKMNFRINPANAYFFLYTSDKQEEELLSKTINEYNDKKIDVQQCAGIIEKLIYHRVPLTYIADLLPLLYALRNYWLSDIDRIIELNEFMLHINEFGDDDDDLANLMMRNYLSVFDVHYLRIVWPSEKSRFSLPITIRLIMSMKDAKNIHDRVEYFNKPSNICTEEEISKWTNDISAAISLRLTQLEK